MKRVGPALTLLVLACSPAAAPESAAPVAPRATDATDGGADAAADATAEVVAAPPDAGVPVAAIVERWNAAHDAHDADALAALYAPTLLFYDTELAGADAVTRKRAALAAAPDYRQTLSDVTFATVDGNGGTFVRFTKTTMTKGARKSFPGYLYVIEGRILAEGDRVVTSDVGTYHTYCYGGPSGTPNDVRAGSIATSGLEAMLAVRFSKAFLALASPRPKLELRDCAHGCRPDDGPACKSDGLAPFFFGAVDARGRDVAAFAFDPDRKTVSR